MATIRVISPCVVVHQGVPTALRVGDPYDSEDDIVREFSWAFAYDNVETATAAPGERRNVRR